jgi:glycosyltransferase involved in cell wall biosynthesis
VLVTSPSGRAGSTRAAWWSARRWLGLVLVLASLAWLAPHVSSGTDLVRVRNALALGPDFDPARDWRPPAVPADWRGETAPPPAHFVAVAQRLGLAGLTDDAARARAIVGHLLLSAPTLLGGGLQADLVETHRSIVEQGRGYCGDFVRAFSAIAGAAGMTLRTWSFSFDGFGGHGHIWVELWNRERQHWELLDVFDNYYFTAGASTLPLSALEFRAALGSGDRTLAIRLIHPQGRPGYVDEQKAWAYFRRGLPQWYLAWGHNPFAVDASWPVRTFTGVSRILENGGAILAGVTPRVRVLATADNAADRQRLRALRWQVPVALAGAALGALLLLAPAATRRSAAGLDAPWPRVCVVGPLPPPSGGMANQCEQLLRLLRAEGAPVEHVRTNAPYRPAWIGRVPMLRAGFRLVPYLWTLWRAIGRADVVHVMANSGWAWHLLAAPALRIARWRSVPAIVNYRGGQAAEFFDRAPRHVLRTLGDAALRVVPSGFLERVFAAHGLAAEVVPNVVDLGRFAPRPAATWPPAAPHLVVTRNLEPIYDIPTALRAFARVRARHPQARLTVAGSGPELQNLQALAHELGIAAAVRFSGRIPNERIGALYAEADLVLNPTTADNMPISILEALASGVPIVSTDAGGIPDLVEHERTALLVPVGDADALASAALRLLGDAALAARLRDQGLRDVARFDWTHVRDQWRAAYRRATARPPLAPSDATASR